MPRHRIIALTVLALLLVAAQAAAARPGVAERLWAQRAAPSASVAPALTVEQAADIARARSGGRVLSADTVVRGGRTVHRVKVLTPEGRVRVLSIDAGAAPR